jgi:Sulfotransferase domain
VAVRRGIRPLTVRLRFMGVRPEDALVVSYPRSGSTWLRFLLTEILMEQPAEWQVVNRTIPDAGAEADAPALLSSKGRLIKTHDRHTGSCRKAIYMVRDARDVMLSEYRWLLRGGEQKTLDQHIRDTLAGNTPMSLYGVWPDHVRYWLGTAQARRGDLFLLKFEDLRTDPHQKLGELFRFLELTPADAQLTAAIENNSLRKMRDKEDRALTADVAPGDPRYPWVGEGAVMGWRSKLSDEQVALLETRTGDVLARLGYPTGGGPDGG